VSDHSPESDKIPGPRFGADSPVSSKAPKNRRQADPLTANGSECENDSAGNEQGVETNTEWADEGLRRGDGTADAGIQKGTDMRRKTILHTLNTPAVCPLISPTRKRADISCRREQATFTRQNSTISSREGSVG
jgi:hypothetical protein